MKKISVVFAVIGIVAVSAYLFMQYSVSTPGFEPAQAKEASAAAKPAETVLDLRPKLIEKLQHLVKQGSNGLYNLFIHEVKPDILHSTITISGVSLVPDTIAMRNMEGSKSLPNEIFKVEAETIRIEGIGINDILSKEAIDLKAIHIDGPTIHVYSRKKSYNRSESKTLYQRLLSQMKHIGIGEIIVKNGTIITHNVQKNKTRKFSDVAIRLSDVLIDSTTQFDRKRFLFAKEAHLSLKNYSMTTSNKLYSFKIGTVSVNATKQLLVAENILLQPNYNKNEFQKQNQKQKERYSISIPSIEFRNADWWQLINNETLQAQLAVINKANISVYLDRRLPQGQRELYGFPHQLVMKLPLKVNIRKLIVADLDVVYEEFSNLSGKKGTVYLSNLRGTITNITNMPEVARKNKTTTVKASGLFMNIVPVDLTLNFDLANYRTGAFTARLETKKEFDGTEVNSIAAPLGLFSIKSGRFNKLVSQIQGNNNQASGTVLMLYKDLHINPLKKDRDNPGKLEKKTVTGFIANTFVIKNENPSKNGETRKETASFTRESGTFFNLVWKTTFTGILKTIGAPEKLAAQQ